MTMKGLEFNKMKIRLLCRKAYEFGRNKAMQNEMERWMEEELHKIKVLY